MTPELADDALRALVAADRLWWDRSSGLTDPFGDYCADPQRMRAQLAFVVGALHAASPEHPLHRDHRAVLDWFAQRDSERLNAWLASGLSREGLVRSRRRILAALHGVLLLQEFMPGIDPVAFTPLLKSTIGVGIEVDERWVAPPPRVGLPDWARLTAGRDVPDAVHRGYALAASIFAERSVVASTSGREHMAGLRNSFAQVEARMLAANDVTTQFFGCVGDSLPVDAPLHDVVAGLFGTVVADAEGVFADLSEVGWLRTECDPRTEACLLVAMVLGLSIAAAYGIGAGELAGQLDTHVRLLVLWP